MVEGALPFLIGAFKQKSEGNEKASYVSISKSRKITGRGNNKGKCYDAGECCIYFMNSKDS